MKRSLSQILVVALAFGISSMAIAQDKGEEKVSIAGWVTDTDCGAKGATADHDPAKCVKEKGAKWAIYNPETKTLWILANPEMGPKMVGKKIMVKGTWTRRRRRSRSTPGAGPEANRFAIEGFAAAGPSVS